MKKLMLLIRVLFKCGKNGKAEQSSSAVGDTKTLITLAIGVAAIVGMFLAGQYAADHTQMLGSENAIFTTLLTAAGFFSFFMAMMNAVNQLYISSDLDVLVTLPFSPMQIVTAKLLSVSVYPAGICCVLIIPAAIGFGLKAVNLSPMFIPVMIIGMLLLSLYVVALVACLLMVIMRVFRFIRSRNILSIISTLLIFAISIGYILLSSDSGKLDEDTAVGLFRTLNSVTSGMGLLFPTVGFTVSAALGQLIDLLYAVLCVAGALVIMTILAKTIYFPAALSMTDANGSRGALSSAAMKKNTAKRSVGRTLARHEVRQILRTPALITNGYLYSIIVPFLIIIPAVLKMIEPITASGQAFSIENLKLLITEMNLPVTYLLLAGSLFSMLIAVLAVALSCLSRYLISREGKDFAVLKTMPISAPQLVFVKRNVAMGINGISGLIIPVLLFIIIAILGLVPVWVSAVCVIINFAWLLMFVDICAATDVAKPNLNWESETDVTKNNYTGMILLGAAFAILIGSILLLVNMSETNPSLPDILGIALCAAPIVGAVICDLRLFRLAKDLY